MDKIIEARELTKYYDGNLAVDDINLEIPRGEAFGLLGPNGAGKTTTVLMLTTLLKQSGGKASVCGFDIAKEARGVRKHISYVPQGLAVDDALTARESLELFGSLYGIPPAKRKQRMDYFLEFFELSMVADNPAATYSGGMKRKLELAQALIHQPEVVFLDEPTIGLDVTARHKIWEFILRLKEEKKVTFFITTHYMDEAAVLCDRVAIITKGKIVCSGSPSTLSSQIGGDVIRIRIEKEDVEKASEALEGMEKIKSKKCIKTELELIVEEGDKFLPEVMQVLTSKEITINSVLMKQAGLDEVFIKYTDDTEESPSPKEARKHKKIIRKLMRG